MFTPDLTAYFAPPPAPLAGAELSIPERMASVIRELRGDRPAFDCEGVTLADFERHPSTCDLSPADLRANAGKAAQLLLAPHDPLADWDTANRLNRMIAVATVALGDEREIFRALRNAGFGAREIGTCWPRIMSGAAEAVRTTRCPEVA